MKGPGEGSQYSLIQMPLERMLDPKHALYELSGRIDWAWFEKELGGSFSDKGRPALSTRLMVGLSYLKHLSNLSDEEVVERWCENPYWQYFCG